MDYGSETDRYEFGYRVLGPIIADYLARLHAVIRHFETQRGAKILFLSRAGLRIRRALDLFLDTSGMPHLQNADYLWASRFMVAKGTWKKAPQNSAKLIRKLIRAKNIQQFHNCIFRDAPTLTDTTTDVSLRRHLPSDLHNFILGEHAVAKDVRQHLQEQSDLFEDYIQTLMGSHKTALLVDTGWQGSQQRLLSNAFTNIDWWGAYLGRTAYEDIDRSYWHKAIGIVLEADNYNPDRPETSLLFHRHMIEHVFEPNGPSIERLLRQQDGSISSPEAQTLLDEEITLAADPIYSAVLAYLSELPHGSSLFALAKEARKCWTDLAQFITRPNADDARLFGHVTRSADFGSTLKVPMMLPPDERHAGDTPENRISESLWPPGQIALEYPPEIAKVLQEKMVPARSKAQAGAPRTVRPATCGKTPMVAVITRTLDRPMFLRRALKSVASQTFINATFDQPAPLSNYLYNWSQKHRFVYMETPKVACTTVKRVLQRAEGGDEYVELRNVHDRERSPLLAPNADIEEFERAMQGPEYFRFFFVRNPFTRILSCYLDKMVRTADERIRLAPKLDLDPRKTASFTEFLTAIAKQSDGECDVHWAPQTYLLRPNRVKYSFIGRFEFFDEQFRHVCKRIGIEYSPADIAGARHATNADEKLEKYMGKTEIDLIHRIYERDFRNFGYGWSPEIT